MIVTVAWFLRGTRSTLFFASLLCVLSILLLILEDTREHAAVSLYSEWSKEDPNDSNYINEKMLKDKEDSGSHK